MTERLFHVSFLVAKKHLGDVHERLDGLKIFGLEARLARNAKAIGGVVAESGEPTSGGELLAAFLAGKKPGDEFKASEVGKAFEARGLTAGGATAHLRKALEAKLIKKKPGKNGWYIITKKKGA